MAKRDTDAQLGRSKMLLAFLMLCVGIGISVASWWFVRSNVQNEAKLKFDRQAGDAHHQIEARLSSYIDILYGLGALFRTSGFISRAQFHNYVSGLGLPRRFPGFLVLSYAEHVPAEAKKRFEAMVRSDTSLNARGYPNFAIKPPGNRAYYHVLIYLEPMEGNEAALGRDILMEPGRTEVLEQLRDSGEIMSSGRVVIVDGHKKSTGLAMRLPVYRPGMPLDTVEQRRAAFRGTIGSGYFLQDLLQNVLDKAALETLRFRVYETGPARGYQGSSSTAGEGQLIFDSKDLLDSRGSAADREGIVLTAALPLEVAGRMWEIHFSAPLRAMISSGDAALPWLVLGGGILVSLLLFGIAYSLASSRSRAVALALEITRDLRRSEEELRSFAERLRSVSRRLVEVQEAERRRLARELHDRVGQSITALGLNLSIIARGVDADTNPKVGARLAESNSLLEGTMDAMRNVMGELRPQGLDEYGLVAPLRSLASSFSERTGIRAVVLDGSELETRAPRAIELAMFRIAQEALNNIAKHSKATRVEIQFSEGKDHASLRVEDDGVGFDPKKVSGSESGWGLLIMRERAEAVGARFTIDARPGRGARVLVEYRD